MVLKYAVRGSASDYNTVKELVKEFERLHPDIGLRLIPITDWARYLVKVQTMVLSGDCRILLI